MVKFKTPLPLNYSPVFEISKDALRTAFYEFYENHKELFSDRKKLSQQTGICGSQLSRLINSEIVPTEKTLEKLAAVLPLSDSERDELLSCSGNGTLFWTVISENLKKLNLTKSELFSKVNAANACLYKQKYSNCIKNNPRPSFEVALALCVIFSKLSAPQDRITDAENLFRLSGYSLSGTSKLEFIKECIGYGYSELYTIDAEYEEQIRKNSLLFVA